MFRIAAHGGAMSKRAWADGVRLACDAGVRNWRTSRDPLAAAVACVQVLEDDGRFNAGRGAHPKMDGRTVELDAAVMTSDDRFGAVACIEDVRHPVLAAQVVHATPHNLVVGQGATDLARRLGLERGGRVRKQGVEALDAASETESKLMGAPVSISELLKLWNYPGPIPDELACDTVGAVATDGTSFAAAASTGGLRIALRGRASDLAAPGGGIFAGPAAAVAVTGNGEITGRHQAARRIHDLVAGGHAPDAAMADVAKRMPGHVGFGAVCVTPAGAFAWTNEQMPWASSYDG